MVVSGKRLFLDICAGATRPLSQAALQAGMHVLSVDPLCAGQLDLFNDLHYEQLLRLSFSGAVWFACASPPCGLVPFGTFSLYLTGSFPSWGPYKSGAAPKCFVLAAVHGAQRFLLLHCCLRFWHECSQTLDVRYIFCGPQCFGMHLQS